MSVDERASYESRQQRIDFCRETHNSRRALSPLPGTAQRYRIGAAFSFSFPNWAVMSQCVVIFQCVRRGLVFTVTHPLMGVPSVAVSNFVTYRDAKPNSGGDNYAVSKGVEVCCAKNCATCNRIRQRGVPPSSLTYTKYRFHAVNFDNAQSSGEWMIVLFRR